MSDKLELIPVEDIKVTKGMTVDQMLKAMGRAGGFTAQKLADATDIAEAMIKKEGCLRILSFPACIMATGTRGVIVDMVKNNMIDLIITTCGTLDHDLSRTFAQYYKGDFMMDDAMLRDEYEISRLGGSGTSWSPTPATGSSSRTTSCPCSTRSSPRPSP